MVPAEQRLESGLARLGLVLDEADRARLLSYLRLLEKWNRTYNLTAVRGLEAMVVRHLLDSLAVARLIAGPRVLDVGSGAGLPGLPLALARPRYHFTLLDSSGRKTRFLAQAVTELGLENVEIIQQRAEKFQPEEKFDTLVSRAFASLSEYLRVAGHLCKAGGRIIAMKGVIPERELGALPPAFEAVAVERLQVPGLNAERCAVVLRPLRNEP